MNGVSLSNLVPFRFRFALSRLFCLRGIFLEWGFVSRISRRSGPGSRLYLLGHLLERAFDSRSCDIPVPVSSIEVVLSARFFR